VGTPSAGPVVLIPFPFSDLSQAKMRPAACLAAVGRGDWILCQIKRKPYGEPRCIRLTDDDFQAGSLRLTSYVRPGKLFTANRTLIARQVGVLTDNPGSTRFRARGALRRWIDRIRATAAHGRTAWAAVRNLRGRDVPIPRRPNREKTRREDTPPTPLFRPPDARAPSSG
jgi:mRNA interferase MazF